MELGESGIRVNAIAPGGIITPIFGLAAGLSQAAAEGRLDRVEAWLETKQPIQRAGVPDDIALAAVYLASDESTFVNGHNLVVDGGLIGGKAWSARKESWGEIEAALKDG